jgi:Protein of unknown function (DUF1236)
MKIGLMISVAAAALLAATNLAAAQGVHGGSKGAESPATAASPKAESSSPAKESAAPSMSKDSEMKHDAAPKSGPTAQDRTGSKTMPQQAQDKAGAATDTKASGAMNNDSKSKASESTTSPGNSKSGTADSKSGSGPTTADTKSGNDAKSAATTGNAATSATAAPPAEKQTQIASAIKQEKVQEVTNVNFNISVGATVPASVHYYPLPSRIVEIYPQWRGYDFILVRGKYVILRPRTHEIVYIIEG